MKKYLKDEPDLPPQFHRTLQEPEGSDLPSFDPKRGWERFCKQQGWDPNGGQQGPPGSDSPGQPPPLALPNSPPPIPSNATSSASKFVTLALGLAIPAGVGLFVTLRPVAPVPPIPQQPTDSVVAALPSPSAPPLEETAPPRPSAAQPPPASTSPLLPTSPSTLLVGVGHRNSQTSPLPSTHPPPATFAQSPAPTTSSLAQAPPLTDQELIDQAQAAWNQDDWNKVVQICRQGNSQYPQSPLKTERQALLAGALAKSQKFEEANKELEELKQNSPNNPHTLETIKRLKKKTP